MIAIGVPVPKNHQIDVRTAAYCSAEASLHSAKWGYCSSKECGVGRSTFTWAVLDDPEITHVYNLDADVLPPPGTLQRLLDHDMPIVAGVYPTHTNDKDTWSVKLNGSGWCPRSSVVPSKLCEATVIGGSTVLIKREVLEKMDPPWFRASYGPNGDYVEKEDEYFSRIARAAGYKLMVDWTIICKHYNYGEI